jgi:hypothetical protein
VKIEVALRRWGGDMWPSMLEEEEMERVAVRAWLSGHVVGRLSEGDEVDQQRWRTALHITPLGAGFRALRNLWEPSG